MKLRIGGDSALMRRQLDGLFEAAGGFEIAYARTGREAVEANLALHPEVVILDIDVVDAYLAQEALHGGVPAIGAEGCDSSAAPAIELF